MIREARALLRTMLEAAIAAAQPALCLPPHLPPPPQRRADFRAILVEAPPPPARS